VITLAFNWSAVASFIPQRSTVFFVVLKDQQTSFTRNEIDTLIELRKYVPNYDAEIYASFASKTVEIGNHVQFEICIKDTGIIKLEKPYFYIFLVSPSGNIVSIFPDLISISAWNKMNPWNTEDYQNFYTDCLPLKNGDTQYYVPRKTLIDGYGRYVYVKSGYYYWSDNSYKILYQYQIKNDPLCIGKWRIYVFLYDEKYFDRLGKILDSQNFVKYIFAEFDVTAKSLRVPENIFNKYLFTPLVFLVSFVSTYLGIYSLIEKYKEKLILIGRKMKEHWLFIICVLAIVFIQLWLLLK
jgi:hypothetical protein